MHPELLNHLNLIAAAPEGVKRLRELILELAVRGKLVPQDPNDEPASELLERIRAEKAKLVAEGKIKKDKPLPEIGEEEKPFELPVGWKWVRVGWLAELVTSGSRDWAQHYSASGAIFVRMGNLSRDSYSLRMSSVQHIRPPSDSEGSRTRLAAGDLLVSITGDVGLLGLIPEGFGEAYINQHTCVVRLLAELHGRYLPEVFRSPLAKAQFNAPQRGIKNSFRLTDVTEMVVPLPPLPEQHRIVAKVDELMALCDRLEEQQTDAASAHATLVKTLLDTLTYPDPLPGSVPAPRPDRFQKPVRSEPTHYATHWPRIAQHFDTLFTTEASIAALKQTLLQLAVMGKLVPQDPKDEPASELLKRIQAEKAKLVAEGKVKKDKPLPEIGEEEKPFELPEGWGWVSLEALTLSGPTNGLSPKPWPTETPYRCLTLSATTRGYFIPEHFKHVNISADEANKFYLKNSDMLIQRANSLVYVGMAAIYDQGDDLYIFPDLMMRIRLSSEVESKYVHSYLISQFGRSYFMGKATGTQGNMPKVNQGTVSFTPIPLPPLPEQHRIVAKVDELMALCDQLAARLKAARELATHYATAATESMLEAA